ncbi:unnamed protein product [Closterium sp. NIES-64]|nr:unnamed protein product [Closterium sp. NIES-64]
MLAVFSKLCCEQANSNQPDLSHNYLTGPAVMPLAARTLDLSSNYLSGPLPDGGCQPLSLDANCFTLPLGCALVPQRQEAACNAFCGVSSAAGAAAACGGHKVCYPEGASLAPTCLCDVGFVQFGEISCVAQGQNKNHSRSQPVLQSLSVLTKGVQRETGGNFTAAPVTLFVYEAGQTRLGCGLELAFHANFTFSLSPRSGRVGFNGFAFVVSAIDLVGSGVGVGYGGMDTRSIAVEFDTLQNKEHGDMSGQHVGLNIRGEDRSLAAVRLPFPLSNRKAYTAWVDYEPGDPGTFHVFLADSQEKPQRALLERRLALCERTRFKGFVGLMLAVQRQPVVVHIEASALVFAQYDGTFKYQDPGCYTGRLNHVVLVVGYFVLRNDGSQNRIAPPFWIVRNSWGVEWGDRGHMRMDIQGGDGVCGINVLPGIYPIVKMDVCGADLKNPCYVGTCINDGKGSYSCICPPNYVESTTIDNFPTCDPANVTANTMAVSGSNWWCSGVLALVGLSLAQFAQLNAVSSGEGEAGRDENHPLPRNLVLQLGSFLLVPCTAFFYTLSVSCRPWRHMLVHQRPGGHHQINLMALNPGLGCSEPIKAGRYLCVERNATFAFTVPRCLQYGVLTAQDTCERLLQQVAGSEEDPSGAVKVNAMHWAELYRNNPGLICSSVIPVSASAVGSNSGVQVRGGGELGWGRKQWEGNGGEIGW